MVKALRRARFKVGIWGPYWKYVTSGHHFNGPAFGHEMARIFSTAKIVLNVHDHTDVGFKPNMRTFEATGCGTLLLSDMAFSLERFFTPCEELVCYSNETELVKLARHYIETPIERATIAHKGHMRAYRDHTYDQRVGEILKVVR
jgi:spore maturation protein CgeB